MTKHSQLNEDQEQVLEYLHLTRQTLEGTQRQQLYWIRLARKYGLTYGQIGEALGMTEGGPRMMLRRAQAVKHG